MLKKILHKCQNLVTLIVNSLYEIIMRIRLHNDQFTIICSNCIGGVIYYRLGKQFLSPTVNMWMKQHDFLLFAENLASFLAADIEFVSSEYNYPVGKLSIEDQSILLYFNHSKSPDEAKRDWNRRKIRVNFENLYLIMYDRENMEKNDLLRLAKIPCKNRLVISEKRYPDIPYVLTMQGTQRPNGAQCLDKNWFGIRTFEKHFDFVKWLNA